MKREIVSKTETKRKNRSISRLDLILFHDVIMFFIVDKYFKKRKLNVKIDFCLLIVLLIIYLRLI